MGQGRWARLGRDTRYQCAGLQPGGEGPRGRPVAAESRKYEPDRRRCVRQWRRTASWNSCRIRWEAGRYEHPQERPFGLRAMGGRFGDFRDWAGIERWSASIADALAELRT
ncbi:hypothetical protein ACFOWZ_04785 [Lentzea rhizosphaerae]|uniref:Uncharacterized protein n=1 Tax=Lentzea rhizosphaerae TaxID=2041025 RepID=A0ABV8BMR8_9PSEU